MKLRRGIVVGNKNSSEASRLTIHGFPSLPPELREMIWKFTVKPRVVHYYYSQDMRRCLKGLKGENIPFNSEDEQDFHGNPITTVVPPILQVCRESRSIGLRFYDLTQFYYGDKNPIYFSLQEDILLLSGDRRSLMQPFELIHKLCYKTSIVMRVRHLAMSQRGFVNILSSSAYFHFVQRHICRNLMRYRALETIYLVNKTEGTEYLGEASDLALVDGQVEWLGSYDEAVDLDHGRRTDLVKLKRQIFPQCQSKSSSNGPEFKLVHLQASE